MTMEKLKVGSKCIVTKIDLPPELIRRLQELGFTPQTEVLCRYRGPGGTVTALEYRGCVLAIRTKDLKNISVEAL